MNIKYILFCLVGYIISVVVGHFLISWFADNAYKTIGEDINQTFVLKYRWTVRVLGVLERFLYTTAIIMNFPEFIAVWLALKIASNWKKWDGSADKDDEKSNSLYKGRAIYNVFIVNTGLSLGFGVISGKIAKWMYDGRYDLSISAFASLVLISICFIFYAKYVARNADQDAQKKP